MLIIGQNRPACQAVDTAPVAEDLTEVNRLIYAIVVLRVARKEALRLEDLGLVCRLGLERPGRVFSF
jgi:hypothetical protein